MQCYRHCFLDLLKSVHLQFPELAMGEPLLALAISSVLILNIIYTTILDMIDNENLQNATVNLQLLHLPNSIIQILGMVPISFKKRMSLLQSPLLREIK